MPVLGVWSAVGRSGGAPRRRRPEALDLEVEGKPGDDPQPACHSDRWAPLVLLLVVHKAERRWGFFNLGSVGFRLLFLRCSGAGVERRCRAGAVNPRDLGVIIFFLKGFSANCTGVYVHLDQSVSVCTYSVLCMLLLA